MDKPLDLAVTATILICGIALLISTFTGDISSFNFGGDVGAEFVPRLFLVVWITLAAIALLKAASRPDVKKAGSINLKQLLSVSVITTAIALTMIKIGFVLTMIPGIAAFLWAFGYRKPIVVVLLSICVPLVIWAVTTFGFELLLPRSPWFGLM